MRDTLLLGKAEGRPVTIFLRSEGSSKGTQEERWTGPMCTSSLKTAR